MPNHHRVRQRLIRNKVFYVAEILLNRLHDQDREAVVVAGTKTCVCRRGITYILHEHVGRGCARAHAKAIIKGSRIHDMVESLIYEVTGGRLGWKRRK